MAFFKSLFGKKKNEESDGQEEYFREDFAPIAKKPSVKKSEPKAAKTEKAAIDEKKPATRKAEGKPSVKAEDTAAPKKNADKVEKSSAEKKATVTKKQNLQSAKSTPKSSATAAKTTSKASELDDDSPEVKGAVAISESKPSANGKWEIRKAKDGRFFFSLYASNHTVIAYSQIYSSTSAVNTGINSVIANAPKCEIEDNTLKKPISIPCPKWEIYLDKAGEYRFRLYAPNGLCICHASHGYATKSGCKGGIESIKRFCTEAKVNKSY